MRIVIVGQGTIGSAVIKALEERGHEAIAVSRNSKHRADVTDPESLKALFSSLGRFDAVVCAVGEVAFPSLKDSTVDQWNKSIQSKAMGQINVVRTALPFIADKGSFTLTSGILADEPIEGSCIPGTINSMVEGFVKSAALDLPRGVRINCISPTVLTESPKYHSYFPGFIPIPAAEVALAYVRSISTPINGRIIKLHKTNC